MCQLENTNHHIHICNTSLLYLIHRVAALRRLFSVIIRHVSRTRINSCWKPEKILGRVYRCIIKVTAIVRVAGRKPDMMQISVPVYGIRVFLVAAALALTANIAEGETCSYSDGLMNNNFERIFLKIMQSNSMSSYI